jgi:orotate phosphoribosyltransferase
MVVEALVDEVRSQTGAANGAWVVRLMALADGLDRELSDPDQLALVVTRLIQVAETLGARSVAGASVGGERLAGAVAAKSAGRLRLADDGSTEQPVLLVDTVLATGTQILAAAHRLRGMGVSHVVAAAVVADQAALDVARRELGDHVEALEVI